jgi:Lipid A 3-O-deacylase (PagL)
MSAADDLRTIYKAVMLVSIAVAAPVLAQDAGVDLASQIRDHDFAQPSEGATPYTQIDAQPSKGPSANSRVWWSRVLEGHLALGAGITYQYDGSKGTNLGVATWTSTEDHYELAAFRFLTAQTRLGDPLAEPNWVFEASRRWRLHWKLIGDSGLDLFVGAGAAYKTKTDDLNGSNWNFAEQLGWRFPRRANGGRVEFAIRHVSNAGLKKPNRGEDFLTWAYVF